MLERGAFELIDLPDRTQILLNHSLVGIIEEVSGFFKTWMEHRNFPDIPLSQLGTHCYEIGKNETGKLRVRIQISVLAFLPREFYIPGSFSVDVVLDEPIVLTNITPLVLDFTPLPKKFH